MREFELWSDDKTFTLAEAIQRLSLTYRVWATLLLKLTIEPNGKAQDHAIVWTKPVAAMDVEEVAEYIARAEFESAVSSVCHMQATGMGRHAVHTVRMLLGERFAEESLALVLRTYREVIGFPGAPELAQVAADVIEASIGAEAELKGMVEVIPAFAANLSRQLSVHDGDTLAPGRPLDPRPETAPEMTAGAIAGDTHAGGIAHTVA
jgi:hypothetical protein